MFNQSKKKLINILKDKNVVITSESGDQLNDVDRKKLQKKLKGTKV